MLRFNSFRSRRYLRTRFVEGAFLLASEASDLELEILDLLRTSVQSMLGDVAIGDAWKVERLTDTSLLVRPGEAWNKGLPFINRFGKDQLVTGAILTLGTAPVGVTVTDHPDGLGKIINFSQGETTPTNSYRIVVAAREELVTDSEDPFLQNANLTESTGQKVRLNFQLNIVPTSLQTESPIPYRDENSTSGGPVTNFPNTGGTSSPNFVNQVTITPTASGNGELISLTPLTGSERIDGRDLELVVRNDLNIGAGIVIPTATAEQQRFSNGTLIDSNGSRYHINVIFNDVISTQSVIRIDKEPDQPNPEIINGRPFTIIKRDVYATDDSNGSPQGRLNWSIADVAWNSTDLISHSSKVTDLRNVVEDTQEFQEVINTKSNVFVVDGGNISWDLASQTITWDDSFKIVNPFSPEQTISAGSAVLVDNGFLVYDLDLATGGLIEKGNLAVTVSALGAMTELSGSPDLSNVSVGNIVVDSAGTVATITEIDNTGNRINTSPALTGTGAATIYQDSYAADTAQLNLRSFTLATRDGDKIYIGLNDLELENGETSQLGDGVSQQLLQLLGSGITETTASPTYASDIRGVASEGFQERIGALTDALGDAQEDRSAYLRSDSEVVWTGTQLEFTEDIVLEVINTKSGTITEHTIAAASSPILIGADESVWVEIDRAAASEALTVNLSGTTTIPAQTQGDKDVFVLFRRVGGSVTGSPISIQQLNNSNIVASAANGEALYQTFTPTSSFDLSTIEVALSISGGVPAPNNTVLDIVNVTSGVPTDTVLFSSSPENISGSVLSLRTFNYSSVTLSSGTEYAFRLSNNLGASFTLNLHGLNSSNPLTTGKAFRRSSSPAQETTNLVSGGTTEQALDSIADQGLITFIPGLTGDTVRLILEVGSTTGSPSGNFITEVYQENGATSTTAGDTLLGTETTDLATFPSSGSISIDVSASVSSGTNYYCVFRYDSGATVDGSNFVSIDVNATSTQSLSHLSTDTGASFAPITGDYVHALQIIDAASTGINDSGIENSDYYFDIQGTTTTTATTGTNNLYLPFTKQLLREGQSSFLGASGSGAGVIKATFYDPLSTSLPTGSTVTIDGVAASNGDTVLYTNLATGNNTIYELSGVGTAIAWDALSDFDGDETPSDGDSVRILQGAAFAEQLAIYNGSEFRVNDVVRFFDGISSNFWELGSIKTTNIVNNSTNNVFTIAAFASENIIMNYSIVRGTNKETGQIYITTDGTTANIARVGAYINDSGVSFDANISGSDLVLTYTADSSGSAGTLKYYLSRWSDSAGGPTGVPNYSGFTGSSTTAAGSPGNIQFHGGAGNLDGDSNLNWNESDQALELGGLQVVALSASTTLNDNQVSPLPAITYSASTYRYAVVEYSIERGGENQVGRMLVSNNGSSTGFSDDFVSTGTVGVTFSAVINAGNVEVRYISTSTSITGNFKYTIRRWS